MPAGANMQDLDRLVSPICMSENRVLDIGNQNNANFRFSHAEIPYDS